MSKIIKALLEGENYTSDIYYNGFHQVADEPISVGGQNKGPKPIQMMVGALAGCIAITLRMYADRKEWNVGKIHVECSEVQYDSDGKAFIEKVLYFENDLDEAREKRLLAIADKCPVSKLLSASITMHTRIGAKV